MIFPQAGFLFRAGSDMLAALTRYEIRRDYVMSRTLHLRPAPPIPEIALP
jgi:hypothetical protein